eukprot:Partr_v1_DN26356_c1_g1_i1_m43472 putative nicotinamide riboside kinase
MLVIGVGGASCSGKSSVSSLLADRLSKVGGVSAVSVMHQDDYFHCQSDIPVTAQGLQNWDCPAAIRSSDFRAAVIGEMEALDQNGGVLIVEGFFLFADDRLVELFDISFLLHVSLDEMQRRRRGRVYEIEENVEYWTDPPLYVESVVYPGYMEHHSHFLRASDTSGGGVLKHPSHVIDSTTTSVDECLALIYKFVTDLLKEKLSQ